MTVEFKDGIPSADECQAVEHSRRSRAKRTLEVAPAFAAHATEPRSIDPVNVALTAASAELVLATKKTYRFIGSSALHFRLSTGSSAAVTTDIYLPANTAVVIRMEQWDHITVIKAAGAVDGIAQATEVG